MVIVYGYGANFPFATLNVNAISEGAGKLFFTVAGDTIFAYVEIQNSFLLGDVNLDGSIDFLDINPFINVLLRNDYQVEADVDSNGEVNFQDIPALIEVLISS